MYSVSHPIGSISLPETASRLDLAYLPPSAIFRASYTLTATRLPGTSWTQFSSSIVNRRRQTHRDQGALRHTVRRLPYLPAHDAPFLLGGH